MNKLMCILLATTMLYGCADREELDEPNFDVVQQRATKQEVLITKTLWESEGLQDPALIGGAAQLREMESVKVSVQPVPSISREEIDQEMQRRGVTRRDSEEYQQLKDDLLGDKQSY